MDHNGVLLNRSDTGSRRLVVIRAGDASLHPGWLDGGEAPTFDLAISYYGDNPDAFSDATVRHFKKAGKWDGLYDFFSEHPDLLDKYDWIWISDDDIAASTATVNRLFDIIEEHDIQIAQPSLTWDSYFAHFVTLQNPQFRLRWTNFVEVMAPVLSSAVVRRFLPAFPLHRFGCGMDLVWARWLSQPSFGTAVIDEVAVRHTRPHGQGSLSTGAGAEMHAEEVALLGKYRMKSKPRQVVYAGLSKTGRLLKRGPRLWATLYAGWRPLRRTEQPTGRFPMKSRRLLRHVKRLALSPLDLTPLPLPFELGRDS